MVVGHAAVVASYTDSPALLMFSVSPMSLFPQAPGIVNSWDLGRLFSKIQVGLFLRFPYYLLKIQLSCVWQASYCRVFCFLSSKMFNCVVSSFYLCVFPLFVICVVFRQAL